MELSSDSIIFWQHGFVKLNLTIVTTWAIMAVLTLISWLTTRGLSSDPEPERPGRWQNMLEAIVDTIRKQIAEIAHRQPGRLLPLLSTLFLFIALSNLLTILPFYQPPTGSLSTTAALGICVFVSVPIFGIANQGLLNYLKNYTEPTFFMLPFNVMGEISRTLAMAVRLFGNIMSGSLISAILLSLAPLIFPVIMSLFGLLMGMVQAYIFAVLAAVYIASGLRVQEQTLKTAQEKERDNG